MYLGVVSGLAAAAIACCADSAMAQADSSGELKDPVAVHKDWLVFEEVSSTKYCWSISEPKESVHTRDGRVVSVRRGEIRLYISFIPERNVNGEITFESGYPFRDGAVVTVDIDGNKFRLFTLGQMAWTNSDEDDTKMVQAMKRGKEAKVVGVSSRGTTTKDTFSLMGVTAAIDDARKRCSG